MGLEKRTASLLHVLTSWTLVRVINAGLKCYATALRTLERCFAENRLAGVLLLPTAFTKEAKLMRVFAVILRLPIAISACSDSSGSKDDRTYVLYRNSVTDDGMRLHVASFDALEGEAYNRGNCEQAQELFTQQPGGRVKFWCEKGRFKK